MMSCKSFCAHSIGLGGQVARTGERSHRRDDVERRAEHVRDAGGDVPKPAKHADLTVPAFPGASLAGVAAAGLLKPRAEERAVGACEAVWVEERIAAAVGTAVVSRCIPACTSVSSVGVSQFEGVCAR